MRAWVRLTGCGRDGEGYPVIVDVTDVEYVTVVNYTPREGERQHVASVRLRGKHDGIPVQETPDEVLRLMREAEAGAAAGPVINVYTQPNDTSQSIADEVERIPSQRVATRR
jgi:hypothetical protein